jgi:hypothetical protein
VNELVLLIFAPVLVVAGVLGFVVPAHLGLVSGAPAYNVFHIVFGVAGLLIALSRYEPAIRAFNVGFGAIDLYQAVASALHLVPESAFRWTRVDDVLHVVIGIALIVIGLRGSRR